jgi:hypothetical protein
MKEDTPVPKTLVKSFIVYDEAHILHDLLRNFAVDDGIAFHGMAVSLFGEMKGLALANQLKALIHTGAGEGVEGTTDLDS